MYACAMIGFVAVLFGLVLLCSSSLFFSFTHEPDSALVALFSLSSSPFPPIKRLSVLLRL